MSEAGASSRNPQRSEGSGFAGQLKSREDLSEAFTDRAGRVCRLGNFVLEHDQRPANSFGNAGGSRDVRGENLDAPKRCAASAQRIAVAPSLATSGCGKRLADVAQLVEHSLGKGEVISSILIIGSRN